MEKRKILIQLDTDPQPSVFDRVVAVDAGADEVFSYGGVRPEQVQGLVHGAIFTRGPKDLKHTAFFIGGSDFAAGERLLEEVRKHMIPQFGLRVSVLLDANGANTTAAAAVRVASDHLDLSKTKALVLGGTGPVGQRVALLLAGLGADVRLGSRQQSKAAPVCAAIRSKVKDARVTPVGTGTAPELQAALAGQAIVFAAGAAGVVLLSRSMRAGCPELRVAVDLNAVPPLGIEGVEVGDKGATRDGIIAFGALGVGGTKMKIHKAAVARLFESNDQVLDAQEVFAIARTMQAVTTTTKSEAVIWGRVIEPDKTDLSPEAARFILDLGFSDADRSRMNELGKKNQEKVLSDEERQELECYMKVGDLLSLLHLKARKSLQR